MAHYTDCLTPRKGGDIGTIFTDEREHHMVDQNGLYEINTSINNCTKSFFADYSNEEECDQFEVAETFRNENNQQPLIPETLDMQKLKRPTYQASDIRYNHDTDFERRRPVVFDGQMHEHDFDEQQDMKVDDYDDVDQNRQILKLDVDGYLKPVNVVQAHNLEPNLTHQDNELRSSFHGYEECNPFMGGTNARQNSNEGILEPPTNSLTEIDEETVIENHYNTIYDAQVVDQGKIKNNIECMMKTKCRILIALLVVIPLMTSVALFVTTFTHPGWSKCNCDHTTFTTKTTDKSGNNFPTTERTDEPATQTMITPKGNKHGHTGSRFWTAFPTAFYTSEDMNLLVLSSSRISTTIITATNVSQYLTDSTDTPIDLPGTLIQNTNTIQQKGILVTTNDSAYVYTFRSYNYRDLFYLYDMSWIPSSDSLGTSYIAVSYHPSFHGHNFISITSIKHSTLITVTINTTGIVKYDGLNYRNNEEIQLLLNKYDTIQLTCKHDITGTQIRSNTSISVQSGFSDIPRVCSGMASIHLPPVPSWGRTFIVPPIQIFNKYSVRIIPSQRNTSLSVINQNKNNFYTLSSTLELNFPASEMLVMECDKPCFVAQYLTHGGDAFYIVTVPAVEQFSRDYRIISPTTNPRYKNHLISVMIQSDEYNGLLLNGTMVSNLDKDIQNVTFSNTKWSALSIGVPEGIHTITHTSPNTVFGVIAYGSDDWCLFYGYVAGLNI